MALAILPGLPDDQMLFAGLATVLGRAGATPARLLDRQPLSLASTFPAEVVTCRLVDGRDLQLFCKYTADRHHVARAPRGGVVYEAAVYRELLTPLGVTVPRWYGAYTAPQTTDTWLFLEYLDRASHVHQAPGAAMLPLAARWLGHFHAMLANRHLEPPPFLHRYDRAYLLAWTRRASRFAGPLRHDFPWLPTLGERFARVAPALLLAAPTVIHGEYYPRNVLTQDGAVYPVDWESAAVAAGEIDLASLTEGWSAEVTARCEEAYCQARWPAGPPTDFARRLDAARLYLQFRWLGDRPEWTVHDRVRPRFARARLLGERLGLL